MPRKLRVLLTGATGYLGSFLLVELQGRGVRVVTGGRRGCEVDLDLGDLDSIAAAVSRSSADAVLNAAALSSVRACESDRGLALAVNGRAAGLLAEAVGGRCLQVSTDLVFDGCGAPYGPQAAPAPLSCYGSTKAEGERAVLAAGGAVVRVPLLIGPSPDGGRGATDRLRATLQEGRALDLYTDEYRTPLHAADAARGLADLLLCGGRGISHLAGHERVSRWELGRRFCALHGLPSDLFRPVRRPVGRPRDVSLSGRSCGRSLDAALRAS